MNNIKEKLNNGEKVYKYKEGGNSMLPKIKSRQPVDLEPVTEETVLKKNDIVFCKVNGRYVTHLITGIKGKQYQISNNKNYVNGWITKENIYGLVVKIHSL